ncbi:hypothetical protein [Sphingomonas sp.]|uniref:hypothetical protein n=1 Tax=Sphingomonas sp. TaxID=28214 RepID=UPI001B1C44D7|nr:hypothetical protein [Sphingomonas sp.]MBO9712874.1 hypothetical protein [Sphingomonas sp.]
MPVIRMIPDTLNEENLRFEQAPLREPVFLNSVPKCGSHLLRNILRMFVPVEQQYHAQFIQWAHLGRHLAAFDKGSPKMSWGHLFFADDSAMEMAGVRKILLVRDPYSWVLARGRFFLSDEFQGNVERLKEGSLSVEELLNLMIFGIYQKAPPMVDIFTNNAVAWLGTGVHLVRYEELVGHLKALDGRPAEYFFATLLDACGIAMPADWRERVAIGSDRKQSGTARENLTGLSLQFPDALPDTQKRLVDYAAPGLRAILGYA